MLLSNLPSPIGPNPMPKKTTGKQPADKKDTSKKQNAAKGADDSKVRFFTSVGVEIGSIGTT